MKHKQIAPAMRQQFAKLETREEVLRAALARIYAAHAPDIAATVSDVYRHTHDGEKVNHGALLARISPAEAARLQRDVTQARQSYPEAADMFPLTVTRFDRLNRIQAAQVSLTVSELATAKEACARIAEHLREYAEECLVAFETYLDHYACAITAATVAAIAANDQRPIRDTVAADAIKTATRAAEMIRECIVRGTAEPDAVKLIADYAKRKETTDSDRIMYTEGTRTTTEAAAAVVWDIADAFRVVCVHDNRACDYCLDVEARQEEEPIPMVDLAAGINAPPLHPRCRCSIEVEWKEQRYDEDHDYADKGDL